MSTVKVSKAESFHGETVTWDDGRPVRITLSTLKEERGWTDGTIKKYLGEPDATAPNPYYRNAGAPMRLYDLKRVIKAEQIEDWQVWKAKRDAQKQKREAVETAQAVAAQAARDQLSAEVAERESRRESVVTRLPLSEVRSAAIESYNDRKFELSKRYGDGYEDIRYADEGSDSSFLNRITDNYIRHNLTDYEQRLREVGREMGGLTNQVYSAIRRSVRRAITEAYPDHTYPRPLWTNNR